MEQEINKMMTVSYDGALRCTAVHIKSGNTLTSDAPPDNNGRGEAFSPTDLLCTALACCMITVMAIAAEKKEIQMGNVNAEIEKRMLAEPRRVGEIVIKLQIENKNYGNREKRLLETAALNCPVAKSLSSELKQTVRFEYL
ncbi:MAG: OsmC family protein [Flavobacteriales bacterium]